jgi:hypothetical protein
MLRSWYIFQPFEGESLSFVSNAWLQKGTLFSKSLEMREIS